MRRKIGYFAEKKTTSRTLVDVITNKDIRKAHAATRSFIIILSE